MQRDFEEPTVLKFFDELKWRGLVHQTTDDTGIGAWLDQKPRTVYAGFDPTADSLHVGSLVPLLALRRFQKAGHRPIAVVGGATGMIGDPSGKSAERNLLTTEQLQANVAGLRKQMSGLLDFDDSAHGALLVDNADWMRPFSFIDFLRDVGKNVPVNVMLAKDSVRSRLERTDVGLSYTEFSYMLLQAYDFVHLHRQYGCELQIGGSDQWGNVTAGIDLGRRMDGASLQGITLPLLTKSDGSKMGKTEKGTVWLDAARTSPYEFYQYWLNVADADAGKCLRFLTELSVEEIESLDAAQIARAHERPSQKRLAEVLTELLHGTTGLARAQQATAVLFGAEIENISDRDLGEIFADVPNCQLSFERLSGDGLNLIDAFVEAGLFKSKSEARRMWDQGGLYVNNRPRSEAAGVLTTADLASESTMVLRSGRKKYALLKFSK